MARFVIADIADANNGLSQTCLRCPSSRCCSHRQREYAMFEHFRREHGRRAACKPLAKKKRISYTALIMAVRACRVTITDLEGISHSVEVTASTLYEAVALGLVAMRGHEWVAGVPSGVAPVRVSVTSIPVEHLRQD